MVGFALSLSRSMAAATDQAGLERGVGLRECVGGASPAHVVCTKARQSPRGGRRCALGDQHAPTIVMAVDAVGCVAAQACCLHNDCKFSRSADGPCALLLVKRARASIRSIVPICGHGSLWGRRSGASGRPKAGPRRCCTLADVWCSESMQVMEEEEALCCRPLCRGGVGVLHDSTRHRSAICHLPSAIRHPPSAISHPPAAIRHVCHGPSPASLQRRGA
jgi:hypothetical protein